jgi:hypothetical protein
MEKTLTFDAEFGPFGSGWGQASVNKNLKNVQVAGKLLAKVEPVDGPVQFTTNPGEVALIDENERSI